MTEVVLADIVKYYDSLDGVTLTGYKGPPALNHVSLSIGDGETISIVGPSGCGKSTMLKVVAGLEQPNQGRVHYNGHDVTDVKPQDRGVGMVFQDYALYPTRQGKGNLSYFFEVHKRTNEELQERVKQTAELMGFDFELLLGQMPDTLSGGQKQRVAIGRCIARDPHLFLMDEPIVNLDAKLRERTRIEIKKLLRRFGITTLYVTHDQQEAIFMGDRIVVMRQGEIEQVGAFDDLYYSPANLFVATFIGTPPLSLIAAVVSDGQVMINHSAWALPPDLASTLPTGPLRIGIRPEGWLLDTPDGAALTVRHVERIPTERASFIHATLAAANAIILAPLDYRAEGTISARPDWGQALYFEAETEQVLYTPGVPDLF